MRDTGGRDADSERDPEIPVRGEAPPDRRGGTSETASDGSGEAPGGAPSTFAGEEATLDSWRSVGATGSGAAAAPPLDVGDAIGSVRLEAVLGEGGMGRVFRGHDVKLDRSVAVKALSAGGRLGPEARARLRREARLLSRLNHPSICQIYDLVERPEADYLLLELVEGETLRRWLEQRPTRAALLQVALRIAEAMAIAHGAGVVHRDLKPENVMVTPVGGVKVLDFGIARSAERAAEVPDPAPASATAAPTMAATAEASTSEATTSTWAGPGTAMSGAPAPAGSADLTGPPPAAADAEGAVEPAITRADRRVGTPGYMSPEQWWGDPVQAPSDVWALGVVLHEVFAGARPFTLELGVMAPPEPRVAPGLERELARLLTRMLAAEPAARPTAEAVRARLAWIAARPARLRQRGLAGLAVVAVGAAALTVGYARLGAARRCHGLAAPLAAIWGEARRSALGERFVAVGLGEGALSRPRTFEALDAWAAIWLGERTRACAAAGGAADEAPEIASLRIACFERRLRELDSLLRVFGEADLETLVAAPKAALALESPAVCADVELLAAPERPPTDPDRRARIAALESRLALAKAERDAGLLDAALAEVAGAEAEAAALAFLPLHAELDYLRADLQERLSDLDRAEASAFAAWERAERSGHTEVVVRSLSLLTFLDGNDRGRLEAARRWTALGEARLARLAGGAPHLAAQLASDAGAALQIGGRHDEALAAHRRALELRESLYGPESVEVAKSRNNIATVHGSRGDFAAALPEYRQVAALIEARLGPEHPDLAMVLSNVGASLTELGRHAEALESSRRALAIRERRFGVGSVFWGISQLNVGLALIPSDPAAAARSLELGRDALAAHGLAEHALSVHAWGGLAAARLEAGEPRAALALFERALALAGAAGMPPADLASFRFEHARALWATSGRASGAVERVRALLAELRTAGSLNHHLLARMESWLAERD